MGKRRERKQSRLTPAQRSDLLDHAYEIEGVFREYYESIGLGGNADLAATKVRTAILVALAEISNHRKFRKERSKRR